MKKNGRIVIYNVSKNQFFDGRRVKLNKIVIFKDKVIVDNIIGFKFKYQERINDEWVDVKNYFYLTKARFLRKFWLDRIQYSDEEVKEIILYCNTSNFDKQREVMITAFKAALNYIIKSKTLQYKNLKQYFRLLK